METNLGYSNAYPLVRFSFLQLYERYSEDGKNVICLYSTKYKLQDKQSSLLFITSFIHGNFNSLLSHNKNQYLE